jgi:hypothetical protein
MARTVHGENYSRRFRDLHVRQGRSVAVWITPIESI